MTTGTAEHFPFPRRRTLRPEDGQLADDPSTPVPSKLKALSSRIWRIFAALVLVTGSVALLTFNEQFRALEASIATIALSPFSDTQVAASGIRYFVWIAPERLVALRVTVECTALIFAVPLTIASALVLAFTRIRGTKVLLAVSLMWVIVLAVNTLRLWVIGFATQTWGIDPGYQLSHTLVGSVIGIIGFVLGVITLVSVMGVTRKRPITRK